MFINTLDIPGYSRLNQILHTLKHVHQFEFDSHDGSQLQETQQHYLNVQQHIVETSAFNTYHTNPEYAKAALITEAIKMLLEIAPKRRKKAAVQETKKKQPKPDFLDVDKDGNKKEPFKKAVADKAKADKIDEKWDTKMKTAAKDVGKWEGWTVSKLKDHKMSNVKEAKLPAKTIELGPLDLGSHSVMNMSADIDIPDVEIGSRISVQRVDQLRKDPHKYNIQILTDSVNPTKPKNHWGKILEGMLLEDENLDKAETLLAAKDLSDRLQDMAEDAAKMAVDRLMPLVDVMKSQFGQEPADAFNQIVKAQLQTVLDTVISAKDQTDNAILTLQGGGVPTTASDISQPLPAAQAPAVEPGDQGMPAQEPQAGGAEEFAAGPATAGPEEEPLGRSMKEPMSETFRVGDKVKFAFVQGMKPIRGTILEFVSTRKTQVNPHGFMIDVQSGNTIYSIHPQHAQKIANQTISEQKVVRQTVKESRQQCMECGQGWYMEDQHGKMQCNECGSTWIGEDDEKDIEQAKKDYFAKGGSVTHGPVKAAKGSKPYMPGTYHRGRTATMRAHDPFKRKVTETEQPNTTQTIQDMATKGKDANGKPLTPTQKMAAKKAADELAKANLEEKLTKNMTAGEIISDFVNSDDPKFQGKSKAERTKMALGAYYDMHPEKSKQQENYNNLKKVVESLTTEFNNLRTQFQKHKQIFEKSVKHGQHLDVFNEGYGLEGAAILEQIKHIKTQIHTHRQNMKKLAEGISQQLQMEQTIINRIHNLQTQSQELPFGVKGVWTNNQKFSKFFINESQRNTWLDYNKNDISSQLLINPQDLYRVQNRLKNII